MYNVLDNDDSNHNEQLNFNALSCAVHRMLDMSVLRNMVAAEVEYFLECIWSVKFWYK